MERGLRGSDPKGSWEWLSFAASLPAKPIPITALSAATKGYTGRCIAVGLALDNTATVGGKLTVYDGQDTGGTTIGIYGFAASNQVKQTFGIFGVLCEIGVYLSTVGGLLAGSLWVVPLWEYNITPPGE